jgi:SAM-dependent methyltransferase
MQPGKQLQLHAYPTFVRLQYLRGLLSTPWPRFPGGARTFRAGGRDYPYCDHRYNFTWMNERRVEIPIMRAALDDHRGKAVLEVGNVLSHYAPVAHEVVDKYERSDRTRIIAQDVSRLSLPERYDLILSISTLEHVGWDESPQSPGAAIDALRAIRNHLKPDGTALFSVPIGYNPHLDQALFSGEAGYVKSLTLRRISRGNTWAECDLNDARGARFGHPYPFANAVFFGWMSPGSAIQANG